MYCTKSYFDKKQSFALSECYSVVVTTAMILYPDPFILFYIDSNHPVVLSVDYVWNAMAHAQKPDFVFRRNGRIQLNRRGASVQSTTVSRCVLISGSNVSNAGYNMFRGSVKGIGYPLHSPVSSSLPLPCVTVYHHISTRLYQLKWRSVKTQQYYSIK